MPGITDFNLTIGLMDRQLDIFGQPCTVYIPTSKQNLGYEDTTTADIKEKYGVSIQGTEFKRVNTKCFINFTLNKSVFYHFNWFPEDSDELCIAYFPNNSIITEESFIRTRQKDCESVWGDLLFKIVSIKDDGKFQTLKRNYFIRPVSSQEVKNLLELGPTANINFRR